MASKKTYSPPLIVSKPQEPLVGYRLKLANGHEWNLVGDEEALPWLQRLASVMELKTRELNGSPRIIFGRTMDADFKEELHPFSDLDPSLLEGLSKEGWSFYDLGAVKMWLHNDLPHVICKFYGEDKEEMQVIRMWQSLYPVYKKIQEAGGFPFHCGFVELNGQGCLLAAPGNTGKSTCCSRIPPPWRAVSDDEAVIVKLKEGKYVVHPMPTWSNFLWRDREGTAGWAGNTKPPATRFTWRAEESIPLKAVFFLEQAPEDSLEVVSQGQAAVYMNDSASQVCRRSWRKLDPEIERGYKRRVFQNACELSKSVPSFLLKVSLTGRFWEKMEEALNS